MRIVADSHIPFIREYFAAYGELILMQGRAISSTDLSHADMLIVRSITRVDKHLLEGTSVKFVGSVTAGADHLDTKWLDEAGISWCIATGFNAPPVADYVVSVIASLQKKGLLQKMNLKAAVIGVGNVGSLVAERLKSLNFSVIHCDPIRALREKGFQSVPLDALHDLDFISLHVPLTLTGDFPTFHFINRDFLQRQKAGCILLNASRGSVINSKELLEYGDHLTWCFDVWEHEPRIDKTILNKTDIATPHIAGYSVQSKIRGVDMIYRIACERNFIIPQTFEPLTIPKQRLSFSGTNLNWRDIVLGVFNPAIITTMLRTVILPATEYGPLFDEMRNQFNYRHEFSYTTIVNEQLKLEDRKLLQELGLHVVRD